MSDEDVKDQDLKLLSEEDLVLTTIDNPYNPKDNYAKWRIWDIDNGYHTEEYLARLIDAEDSNVDMEDDVALNQITTKVIQDIMEHDMLKVYILV